MRASLVVASMLLVAPTANAADIAGDFRPRPPEMVIDGDKFSGPLKDVIEEAVQPAGDTITWSSVPFARSLKELQDGTNALVPRMSRTPDREAFTIFLGPIAIQKRAVLFAVRKGDEDKIKSYDDLVPMNVAVKRGTVYFEKFDKDAAIKKQEVADDNNLAVVLRAGHIDAAIFIDPAAFEAAAKAIGWDGWGWASWKEQMEQGNFYGIAKTGPLAGHAEAINSALKKMVESGRIKAIYAKYGLDPEKSD